MALLSRVSTLGKMSQKGMFWAIVSLIVIVVLFSSVLGTFLYNKEASTGGMDLKWKMDFKNGETVIYQMNDTIIVNFQQSKQLRSIDVNGTVVWSYSYTELLSTYSYDNSDFCFIDKNESTRTLLCMGENGSIQWSFTNPGVENVYYGEDGNYYIQIVTSNKEYIVISSTMVCIDREGIERWADTEVPYLCLWGVLTDGTCILRHDVCEMNDTSNNYEMINEELISFSTNGQVLSRLNTSISEPLRFVGQENNGTIIANYFNLNCTFNYLGLTEDLRNNWSLDSSYVEGRGQTIGSVNYKFKYSCKVNENGNEMTVATLCAYNVSDGVLLFETRFWGTSSSWVYVNDGTAYVEDGIGRFWAVDPSGRAYLANDTDGWKAIGIYGNGMLLYDDFGLKLIDDHGSTEWQYDIEEGSIKSIYLGMGDGIFLVTDAGISVVHKPQVSTTTMYIITLISFDMLVLLTSAVWLIDHWLPRKNTYY
jgi:hypothetical protein